MGRLSSQFILFEAVSGKLSKGLVVCLYHNSLIFNRFVLLALEFDFGNNIIILFDLPIGLYLYLLHDPVRFFGCKVNRVIENLAKVLLNSKLACLTYARFLFSRIIGVRPLRYPGFFYGTRCVSFTVFGHLVAPCPLKLRWPDVE